MKVTRIILILAIAAIVWADRITSAQACGPDFEIGLLSQRSNTMLELPDGVFLEEVHTLVPTKNTNYSIGEFRGARQGGGEKERLLYDRGASLFRAGNFDAARSAFLELLALPAEDRQFRSTWATYMLGETTWPHSSSMKYYRKVRQLVAQGFRDDLGLAAASLGQEAYIHLRDRAPNLPAALALYAEQAAHGHSGGALSLLFLVRESVESNTARELAQDPIGRSLLGIYLYTRRHELRDEGATLLFDILADFPPDTGSTRLAAAAYREGRWQMAEKLAAHNPQDNLSKWVLAKLALRAGNRAKSEALLAEISTDASSESPLCDTYSRARVSAESVIWALQEGHSSRAMQLAWDAKFSAPMSNYIAERVLSVGELRDFIIDRAMPIAANVEDVSQDHDERSRREELRRLFARRLMRAGFRELQNQQVVTAWYRFREAQSFFTGEEMATAGQMAKWLTRGQASGDSIEKADALYRASLIARSQGLEILGTSDTPDWESMGAQFDMAEYWPIDTDPEWMGQKEQQRIKDSAPLSSQRYHYRQLASKLAEQAADALPVQSQAFAATLCHATRYVFNTDRARVGLLWSRYVRHGPAVDFAGDFGIHCPEPEFVAARRYLKEPSPAWPWLVGALLALSLMGGLVWRIRRTTIHRGPIGELDQMEEGQRFE